MPCFELGLGDLECVVVGDLQAPGQDVAQQAVGLGLAVRVGAAAEDEERLGLGFGPGFELGQQSALTDAGLGDHGNGSQLAFGEQALEGFLQCFKFGVAADHPCGHAFDAPGGDAECPGLGAQHQVALDRRVHALDADRAPVARRRKCRALGHRCHG